MARAFPSMTALLGLLAIVGYQNRDKISEFLKQRTEGGTGSGLGALLGDLGKGVAGTGAGSIVAGGLGELIERFKSAGAGDTADSWVKTGENKPCTPEQLEKALGPEVLATLQQETGLSRSELIARLCSELPGAVDRYTPAGHIPTEEEFARG